MLITRESVESNMPDTFLTMDSSCELKFVAALGLLWHVGG